VASIFYNGDDVCAVSGHVDCAVLDSAQDIS
jgi:hypothetical protein